MAREISVQAVLVDSILLAGSSAEFARQKSLNPSYVGDVLRGRRDPGKKILDALGLEKVVTYRRKAKEESK